MTDICLFVIGSNLDTFGNQKQYPRTGTVSGIRNSILGHNVKDYNLSLKQSRKKRQQNITSLLLAYNISKKENSFFLFSVQLVKKNKRINEQ